MCDFVEFGEREKGEGKQHNEEGRDRLKFKLVRCGEKEERDTNICMLYALIYWLIRAAFMIYCYFSNFHL